MNDLQAQKLSAENQGTPVAKRLRFVAPSSQALDQYAHEVCQALEQNLCSKPDRQQSEFVRGFAAFVKTIVRIHAKHLNQGGQHEEQ